MIEVMHLPIEIEDDEGDKTLVDHSFFFDFDCNPILIYPVYNYYGSLDHTCESDDEVNMEEDEMKFCDKKLNC